MARKPILFDPTACEGCGVCIESCPTDAIDFPERRCGEWMISDTACGPMVHARLGIAAENSGKLVTTVRQEARRIAENGQHPIIIVDGPPGIGCPVIASITGAFARTARHRTKPLRRTRSGTGSQPGSPFRNSDIGLRQQVGHQPRNEHQH